MFALAVMGAGAAVITRADAPGTWLAATVLFVLSAGASVLAIT